jgi:ribonuclease HII
VLFFERQAWSAVCRRVAGVDEAGRGPLAGPVVAAAVVFPSELIQAEIYGDFSGLTDSKQLTPAQRDFFYRRLTETPGVEIGVGVGDVELIDRLNILGATHYVMAEALNRLSALPDLALIDGLPVPGLPCRSQSIVGGDARSLSIAAASVIAKVTRDRMMEEMDRCYPGYGFARHKGYGTQDHMRALFDLGPCPIHRRSFRPVREAMGVRARME